VSVTELRLSEVVAALSHALDLTEGQPQGHAVRTCLIGMRIASELDLSSESRSALFYALLLKDAGCSSNASRVLALFRTDDHGAKRRMKTVDFPRLTHAGLFALRAAGTGRGLRERVRSTITLALAGPTAGRELVAIRCERGAEIARMLGFHEETAGAIRALDEHWNGRGHPDGLRGEQIPQLARIACLAQTVDVFVTERGVEAAYEMARSRRGRWFEPRTVDALDAFRGDERFWSTLGDADVSTLEPGDQVLSADEQNLDQIAEAFARVIDAKSPYTHRHSERVAEIAVAIGRQLGNDAHALRELRRSALLHDIGKLAIPNTILDKPGGLTDDERAVIAEHPRHSEEILGRVEALHAVAVIAGAHHERLDGSGYPGGRMLGELSLPMRILAVADVWEALTAERPYRAAMSTEEALAIVRKEAGLQLCAVCVGALEQNLSPSGELLGAA
jgi:HD-GYP domain-containing protein (c-di-GMP phosphodiesterase class II)